MRTIVIHLSDGIPVIISPSNRGYQVIIADEDEYKMTGGVDCDNLYKDMVISDGKVEENREFFLEIVKAFHSNDSKNDYCNEDECDDDYEEPSYCYCCGFNNSKLDGNNNCYDCAEQLEENDSNSSY